MMPDATIVEVDVRDDLRAGREPFQRIMAAVTALRDDEVLLLRAIFEPVPLLKVLEKRGLSHEVQRHAEDDWSVRFWRPAVWLDVRGLEPPEPLTRTLAALETLPAGQHLLHVNVRAPRLLFPMLAERGFSCSVDESREDRVLVRIWRETSSLPDHEELQT